MALTAADYSALRAQCLLWAEAADTQDDFEAFLALAETWKRINDFGQNDVKKLAPPAGSASQANGDMPLSQI